uniref:Uncharacterized protein n=1 Tax=Oryza rufipogon TaxID=4529 RepID=A0A0E0MWP7_ORYRU
MMTVEKSNSDSNKNENVSHRKCCATKENPRNDLTFMNTGCKLTGTTNLKRLSRRLLCFGKGHGYTA